jgi:LysM repeat protein
MLSRILSCLVMSCVLVAPAGGQYGQERPRRVNPPAEQPITPPAQPASGSTLYVVNAEAGDTLRKISAREQVALAELVRVNGIDSDEELEEGREIRFYSSGPREPDKVFTFRTKYEGDTLAKIASRLRLPVDDLLRHNSFGPDEPLSVGEVVHIPFTQSYIDNVKQELAERPQTTRTRKRQDRRTRRPASRASNTKARGGSSTSDDYYTNVDGARVHRPVFSSSAPSGVTAQCRDGSYSFSRHRRGTCSHHGGVARWL